MPGVLSRCCQRKNSRACANERIPRRHTLATSHWQRYVSDQNTVAKYRPCSSTFCGNCSFCTLPNVFACQNSLKHFASHFYTLAGNSLPPRQCTQEVLRIKIFRIKTIQRNLCLLYFGMKYLSASATSGERGAFGNVQNEQFPQKVLEHGRYLATVFWSL